jgi:hypothetical protein
MISRRNLKYPAIHGGDSFLVFMRKKKFTMIYVIISLMIISCIPLEYEKNLSFYDNEGSDNYLYVSSDGNILTVGIFIDKINNMEIIKYCSGYIIIGDYSISLESYYEIPYTKRLMLRIVFNESIGRSKINEIIKKHKTKAQIYLEYEVIINDETSIYKINREIELKIIKDWTYLIDHFN